MQKVGKWALLLLLKAIKQSHRKAKMHSGAKIDGLIDFQGHEQDRE